jgi:hypothetical protein
LYHATTSNVSAACQLVFISPACQAGAGIPLFIMARGFFKNYRVYLLATVAYMGSLLFGPPPTFSSVRLDADAPQVTILE